MKTSRIELVKLLGCNKTNITLEQFHENVSWHCYQNEWQCNK